ncbi:MAG: hypothetical protein K9L80_02575 [Candidatus Omnitrophica bacterium]|nr:hypothetical protein [Candidatus Omnitrophota bacterium]MCF7887990.1 hypothetical protein [Candidatus Omnitrophota bacterium]
MEGSLNIEKCFKDALEIYKQHWQMLVVLNIVLGLLIFATLGIMAGPLVAGYNFVLIELLRKKKERVEISDLFKFFDKFWQLVGLFFLQLIIILGGTILLIIPGIVFSIMLLYVFYLAADKGLSSQEAIKRSWEIVSTKGFWPNFAIAVLGGIIMMLVQMIPFLGYILGFFISPFTVLLIASAYIQQVDQDQGELNLQTNKRVI